MYWQWSPDGARADPMDGCQGCFWGVTVLVKPARPRLGFADWWGYYGGGSRAVTVVVSDGSLFGPDSSIMASIYARIGVCGVRWWLLISLLVSCWFFGLLCVRDFGLFGVGIARGTGFRGGVVEVTLGGPARRCASQGDVRLAVWDLRGNDRGWGSVGGC
jgi:hypothetical protein